MHDAEDQYHTAAADQTARRISAVMLLNVLFSGLILFWWSEIELVLGAPLRWATWSTVTARPELLEYPFVLVWGLPLLGVAAAWLLRVAGSLRPAMWVALFPLAYIGTLVACFYVVPHMQVL